MNNYRIVTVTSQYIRKKLEGEGSGHDWWHIYRVWNLAKLIGRDEQADLFVVELAALLHDIADWKFYGGDEEIGPRLAREWLEKQRVDEQVIEQVCDIIVGISFKGAGVATKLKTIEGQVVQDADRLDALGAIGIARCFAYGGHKGREIYNPNIKPQKHQTSEEYKKSSSPSVNHFYEKLLLLKDLMNTNAGKRFAEKRHKFMELYLKEFYSEWRGES